MLEKQIYSTISAIKIIASKPKKRQFASNLFSTQVYYSNLARYFKLPLDSLRAMKRLPFNSGLNQVESYMPSDKYTKDQQRGLFFDICQATVFDVLVCRIHGSCPKHLPLSPLQRLLWLDLCSGSAVQICIQDNKVSAMEDPKRYLQCHGWIQWIFRLSQVESRFGGSANHKSGYDVPRFWLQVSHQSLDL